MSENDTNVPLLEMKSQEPNGTEILKADPKESQSPTRKISRHFKLDRLLSNDDDDDFFESLARDSRQGIGLSKDQSIPEASQCLQYIDQLQDDSKIVSDGNEKASKKKGHLEGLKNHLNNCSDWPKWKFSIQITVDFVKDNYEESGEIEAEINLIQAVTMRQDIEKVKIVTSTLDMDRVHLKELLKEEISCTIPEKFQGYKLAQNYSWIKDATAIHLAACWHVESLVHFLELDSSLSNIQTKTSEFMPIHVASIQSDTRGITALIHKQAKVNARNALGQTALHLAAEEGLYNNVITLMFKGDADILALDDKKCTPLHLAGTSKILDLLLSKTNAEKITSPKLLESQSLFKNIVERHPSSIKTYLDLMVTSKNLDANIKDQHLTFHLDTFNQNTTKESNYLDKQKLLLEHGCPEMLQHPLMKFFTYLKWAPHKKLYYFNFCLFLAFLVSFTYHGINSVKILQCSVGDLWKLEDTTLMDNAGIWQSPNEWNFLLVDKTCDTSCQMYIENASNHTLVLGIEGNEVNPEQLKVFNATEEQRWKLDNNTLTNEAGLWKSNDSWIFKNKTDGLISIENTSIRKVLGATSDGKVVEEVFVEGKANQLWKRVKLDAEGYLAFENSGVPKNMTAISNSSLGLKDSNIVRTPGQLWIKGEEKAETKGYFSLMNFDSSKELVAISSSFLTMQETDGNLPNSILYKPNSCWGELQQKTFIAKYLTWTFIALLLLWEVFQFLSNVLAGNWREYFSKQNFCELAMLWSTITFLVIQWQVENDEIGDQIENALKNAKARSSYEEVLLGWSLFFAWVDLTIILGRFDVFGRHIYSSWYVLKTVAWFLVVYIPIMMAFAMAFHCFLIEDEIFNRPTTSFVKVLTMVLGEFEFETHFYFDKVAESHGQNFSVQIMFVLFVVYGGIIMMNLIMATIVVNQKDESDSELILIKQRIEEISSMANLTALFKFCQEKPKDGKNNIASHLYINSVHIEQTNRANKVWYKLKNWITDEHLPQDWSFVVQKHNPITGNPEALEDISSTILRDIVKFSLKMLAEKKSRKSELMNIIQEVLRQNDEKLKELLANEENGTTLWTNLPKAPEGYKFEALLYRTPEGALLKIKNETELLDL